MSGIETRQTEGSTPSSGAPSHIHNGGYANVGVGFFLAVFAFGISLFALGGVVFGLAFGYFSTRDQISALKDDNIKMEEQIKLLQIDVEEYMKQR
jgi:hypothetical protein